MNQQYKGYTITGSLQALSQVAVAQGANFAPGYCEIIDPSGRWIGGSTDPKQMIDSLTKHREDDHG